LNENCLFCKFASGKIKPEIVYEDEKCLVIMDKFPLSKGQTLIIGKPHIDYVFDLEDEDYLHCFKIAKKIAKVSDEAFGSERCWLLIQGLQVAHNHIKIIPYYKGVHIPIEEGTGKEVSDKELREQAEKIKKAIQS